MHLPQKTVLNADFEIKSGFRDINLITLSTKIPNSKYLT